MQLTSSEKVVGKIAAGLGILQGIVWLIMAFICVGILYSGLDYYKVPTSYMGYVNMLIESRFLDIDFLEEGSPFVLTPRIFSIFLWIYIIWNIFWVVASAQLIQVIKKPTAKIAKRYQAWTSIAICLTLLDIIFSIILLVDYGNCMDYFNGYISLDYGMICANSTLPVLVIVGRGYTLLVINIIVIYLMFKCCTPLKQKATGSTVEPVHPSTPYQQPYSNYPAPYNSNTGKDYEPEIGFVESGNVNNQLN